MTSSTSGRAGGATIARYALAVLAAAGLAYDAYAHFDLASNYDLNRTGTLSQGDLFRTEAVVAIVAGVLVLVRPRRWTAVVAALVGASALAALIAYRYWNIGRIGPIPSMYEPVWFPEKTRSGYAEGLTTIAALALVVLSSFTGRRSSPSPSSPAPSGPSPRPSPTPAD